MVRTMKCNVLWISILLLVFATGCATRKSDLKYSGFMEDYSKLEPIEGGDAERYLKPDVDLSKYTPWKGPHLRRG